MSREVPRHRGGAEGGELGERVGGDRRGGDGGREMKGQKVGVVEVGEY